MDTDERIKNFLHRHKNLIINKDYADLFDNAIIAGDIDIIELQSILYKAGIDYKGIDNIDTSSPNYYRAAISKLLIDLNSKFIADIKSNIYDYVTYNIITISDFDEFIDESFAIEIHTSHDHLSIDLVNREWHDGMSGDFSNIDQFIEFLKATDLRFLPKIIPGLKELK